MNILENQHQHGSSETGRITTLKSACLSNLRHEICTPLNAIIGFTSVMLQADDSREKEVCREVIEYNNKLLLKHLNHILDFLEIDAGTLEYVYTDIEVNDMLFEIEQMLKWRTKDSKVKFDLNLPMENLTIHTSQGRLSQIIVNLVSNALNFTEQGVVQLGYWPPKDGRITFYVSDTGIGIPADKQDIIFNRFIKLDAFKQGTGLGLYISKSLVNALGGEIGVSSEPGDGSTFWFTIPCS